MAAWMFKVGEREQKSPCDVGTWEETHGKMSKWLADADYGESHMQSVGLETGLFAFKPLIDCLFRAVTTHRRFRLVLDYDEDARETTFRILVPEGDGENIEAENDADTQT